MQPVPSITLHGQILPWSRSERYLGIELDRNMTLTQQANSVAAKSKRNMNVMKVLSSLTSIYGHILKRVYCACVQSSLEYGAIVTPDVQDQYQNATKNVESRHAIDFRGT